MSQHKANLTSLVIANGQTDSTTPLTKYLDDAQSITIAAPAAVTGVIAVRGSIDGGVTYTDIGSGGVDITIVGGNSITISPVGYDAIKVTSGSAEGAERIFQVSKKFVI